MENLPRLYSRKLGDYW